MGNPIGENKNGSEGRSGVLGPILDVAIEGAPVPKGRPRMTRSGHVFTPKKTRDWEALAAAAMMAATEERGIDDLVAVDVEAVAPRPQRLKRKKDLDGLLPMGCKPDGDNILKAALDALTASGVITDDARAQQLSVAKYYGPKSGSAWVRVRAWRL